MIPSPTRNIATARRNLSEHGYCLLENVMDADTIARARRRLREQAVAEKALGYAFEDGGPTQAWGDFQDPDGRVRQEAFREENGGVNQRLWMLVNKGQIFLDLLETDAVLELIRGVLGEHVLLHSYTANIARPGGVAMDLHIDQWWMPPPASRTDENLPVGSMNRKQFGEHANASMLPPAACANVIWMLDDFTEHNGATHVVPGSHLSGRHPDSTRDADVETVQACAPAGSVLITDGRTWHGTGANVSDRPRHAVLTTFCGPQFRQQENFVAGTRREVVDEASPALLAMLGFQVWCGYGRTGHPTVEMIDRDEEPVGELRVDLPAGD